MPRDDRNRTSRRFSAVAIAVLVLLCCAAAASPALAKVKVTFDVGWENKFRPGKWTPLFITLQETEPRQVVIEVYCPTDRRYALNVKQGLTIGPQPVTVPIYVPLSYRLDETTITVRDADSGRRLESIIVNDFPVYGNQQGGPQPVGSPDPFIVISGNSNGERTLQAQFRHQNISTAFTPANRLPITPVGYESMDLLLLNQPDLSRFSIEQQTAIASWVRGGGLLVIVPGSDPAPTIGPIAEILPARIGEIRQLNLDRAILQDAGLPGRFAKLTGRDLRDPTPDARAVPLFDPAGPKAVRRWVGMGQVMLLPIEVSTLAFDDGDKALAFWRATLKGVIDLPVAIDNNSRNYWGTSEDPRRAIAVRQTLDWIGDVPGAGSFGFSYVAIVLLAMMVIVGPVDWFVLKWMGRQPWTWVTISGWIGVITLGSIFIGHIFKSGDVHYRTASLIDEAGGARVASIDLAGIYSPQTTEYDLEMTPHSWWRAASMTNPWGSDAMLTEIPCHQDYRGSRPLPMLINVWNVRFIEGQELGEEPAMVQAQLTPGPGRTVTGSITNRAPFALRDILIRTRDGLLKVKGSIEPGATMQVSGSLVTDKTLAATTQISNNDAWALYSQEVPSTQPTPQSINGVGDQRSVRIDQQLADRGDDVACVYASYDAPPSERLKLTNVQNPHTAHVGVIRALVTMQRQAK